jgi:hypothetical protein
MEGQCVCVCVFGIENGFLFELLSIVLIDCNLAIRINECDHLKMTKLFLKINSQYCKKIKLINADN